MTDELRAALDPVADALDAVGVPFRIGGSVASSALGIARSSIDVDLVADLRVESTNRRSSTRFASVIPST